MSGELIKFDGRGDPRKTEWYKAENAIDANGITTLQVTYNSHHDTLKRDKNYTSYSKTTEHLSDAERKATIERVRSHQEKRKKEAVEETKTIQEQALKDRERFEKALKNGNSPYLKRKQVGSHDVRFEHNLAHGDLILIPMRDENGEIQALQEIHPNKIALNGDLTDKKYTNKGISGLYYTLGEIKDGDMIRVSEGYATASSVYEATGCKVPHVVSFSAYQHKNVIPILKRLYPNSPITIFADNNLHDDPTKKNVGLEEARKVSEEFKCNVVFPVFPDGYERDEKGKFYADFNDLRVFFGDDAVKNCLIPKNLTFKSHSYKQLLELPPKKWLVHKLFGEKEIGMIYGDSGTGKTFVVIDMIISLAIAKTWAGVFDVTRPLTVAYCCGEGISGLPERLKTAVSHYELDDIPNFHFFPEMPQLFAENIENEIKKFVLEWKMFQSNGLRKPLDVLFIDTFHTAIVGAEENSSKEMGIVIHNCRHANKELGCTVIVVHHTTKSGESYRGSGAIKGALDFSFEVENAKTLTGFRKIRCEKIKDEGNFQNIHFRLQNLNEYHKSVYVEWIDPTDVNQDEDSDRSETESSKNEILAEMKRNPKNNYTVALMASFIGKTPDRTRKLLDKLNKENRCLKELEKPKKNPSSTNPYLYKWIEGI